MKLNFINNENFLQGVKHIPDESIDLVVTDPPYKMIGGGKSRKGNAPKGILTSNTKELFKYNDISIDNWLPEVYRVLKPNSHCYVMVNTLNLREFLNAAHVNRFKLHNLLVWKKNNCTPNKWYMKNAEYVLFLRKGQAKKINNVGDKTVHEINNILNGKLHPAEKPIELIKMYIENSSNKGDIILDPFMGSGTTAIAAMMCDRHFIGYEIDKEYYDIAQDRIVNYLVCSKVA